MMDSVLHALRQAFAPLQVPLAIPGGPAPRLPCLMLPLSLPVQGQAVPMAPILWFSREDAAPGQDTPGVSPWMEQLARLIPPGGVKYPHPGGGILLLRDTPFLTLIPEGENPLVMGLRMGLLLRAY